MSEDEVISEFSYLWTEQINNFVLVKDENFVLQYVIMNTIYNSMLIIEDDAAAKFVIKKMIDGGARIVTDFEEVRNPNRPESMIFLPEDREISKHIKNAEKKNEE